MENEMNVELPIDNLDDLKESVKMCGFGEHFSNEIEEKVRAGLKEFVLEKTSQIEGDQVNYALDIRIDAEKRKGHVNDLHTTLKEANGMERSQRSPRFLRVTAKEAYNMLKWGLDTSVEKNLFNKEGKPYHSFIMLDTTGGKDESGNYPLQQYHDRYYSKKSFVLENELQKLGIPVKELEANPDYVLSSLKRGNMTAVTIFRNGQEEKGFLSINAKAGKIDIRDMNKMVIEVKNQSVSISESKTESVTQEKPTEEVKKTSARRGK